MLNPSQDSCAADRDANSKPPDHHAVNQQSNRRSFKQFFPKQLFRQPQRYSSIKKVYAKQTFNQTHSHLSKACT